MAAIGGDTDYYAQKIDRNPIDYLILSDWCAIEWGVGSCTKSDLQNSPILPSPPTPLSCRFFILGEPQNKNDAPKLGRGEPEP
jgi:hypothetical protein